MNIILSFAAAACFFASVPTQEAATAQQSSEAQYSLEAILVLTPDQCSEESKKGNWVIGKEKYRMGELLCPAAEAAVQRLFEKYTRIESVPEKGSAQGKVVLTPRLVDLETTRTATAFGKRKMALLVEWTATDDSGKVFWVQTVEANAQEKSGNLFTGGKHRRKMLESVQKDFALKSIQAMRESPEFQKLAQRAR